MSDWLLKSNTSDTVARNLHSEEYYDTAVHCKYYSCIQLMLHILDFYFNFSQNEIDTMTNPRTNGGKGAHKAIHSFYYESLNNKDPTDAYDFNNIIGKLQRKRTVADYGKTQISIIDYENCANWQNDIKEILNKHYN